MENLSRLASKPGVQSTLVLSKIDGSIIRSSGLLGNISPSMTSASGPDDGSANIAATQTGSIGDPYDISKNENTKTKSAEAIARIVFSFVSAAGDFVDGVDGGDDLKLLRVRTRKNEIVIVPGWFFSSHSISLSYICIKCILDLMIEYLCLLLQIPNSY